MSAAFRLGWTYFAATPLTRRLAALGLVCFVVGLAGYTVVQPWTLGVGLRQEAIWLQATVLALPWLGLILLVSASALLPGIVERLSLGRGVWVLPGGRLSLLASTALTAALLASLTAAGATAAFIGYPLETELGRIFYRTLFMAFGDFGLIYTAIWLVGKTSGVWRLVGTLGIVISITIPLRYIGGIPPFTPLEALGLASWLLFAILLLAGGRIRHALSGLRVQARQLGARAVPAFRYVPGTELDLMLGTTRPWIVALGQIVPIAVMVWFVPYSPIWILFLVTFSAISGAITSQAAARSRRLWLRFDWNREQIRHRVEWAFWRYNAFSLGVLLLLFVGLGLYAELGSRAMMHGIALIVLGTIVCTYLGLIITRGLGWFESIAGILTMTALTLAALSVARNDFDTVLAFEALLGGLAIVYLLLARSRWLALDWMQCRFETPVRGAG